MGLVVGVIALCFLLTNTNSVRKKREKNQHEVDYWKKKGEELKNKSH